MCHIRSCCSTNSYRSVKRTTDILLYPTANGKLALSQICHDFNPVREHFLSREVHRRNLVEIVSKNILTIFNISNTLYFKPLFE